MAKIKKKQKTQTNNCYSIQTLHRKLKAEQNEPHQNSVIVGAHKSVADLALLVKPVVLVM